MKNALLEKGGGGEIVFQNVNVIKGNEKLWKCSTM
jgi:hypothetical protein